MRSAVPRTLNTPFLHFLPADWRPLKIILIKKNAFQHPGYLAFLGLWRDVSLHVKWSVDCNAEEIHIKILVVVQCHILAIFL